MISDATAVVRPEAARFEAQPADRRPEAFLQIHHRTLLASLMTAPLPAPGTTLIPAQIDYLVDSMDKHSPTLPPASVPHQTKVEHTIRTSHEWVRMHLNSASRATSGNGTTNTIEALFSERIIVDLLLSNAAAGTLPYETLIDTAIFEPALPTLVQYSNQVHTAVILSLPGYQRSAAVAAHIVWLPPLPTNIHLPTDEPARPCVSCLKRFEAFANGQRLCRFIAPISENFIHRRTQIVDAIFHTFPLAVGFGKLDAGRGVTRFSILRTIMKQCGNFHSSTDTLKQPKVNQRDKALN